VASVANQLATVVASRGRGCPRIRSHLHSVDLAVL